MYEISGLVLILVVPLVEATVTAGVLEWRSVTLKCHPWGQPVRHLKCVALWRWISLCEYIIFQWGNPQELFFVWNNGKECVLGDGRGSGASTIMSFHEFRYSETPQDKHCSVFHLADSQTKLHVLDFHVPGAELELPPHCPSSSFLHCQHLNTVLLCQKFELHP